MKKYLPAVLSITTVALEILPFGAVLNFAQPPEEAVRSLTYYYSYFDLAPFGFANFGPFLTAVLTSVILILTVLGLFLKNKNFAFVRTVLCGIAFITSLMPLALGVAYYTVLGLCISLMILINGIVTYCFEVKK